MLTPGNIKEYINEAYGISAYLNEYTLKDIEPIKQSDFGGKNDCTLSSMTMLCHTLMEGKHSHEYIYKIVEKEARNFFFSNKNGLLTMFINAILKRLMKTFKLYRNVKHLGIKNVGYNWQRITQIINTTRQPIVLCCTNDGFDYYQDHCVLVIGYASCGNAKFLIVYDNWSKEKRYIDYAKLGRFSSLDYTY